MTHLELEGEKDGGKIEMPSPERPRYHPNENHVQQLRGQSWLLRQMRHQMASDPQSA